MNRLKRGISASLLLVFIVMLSSCKEDIKITKGLDKDTGFVIMNRETSMSLLKLLLANEVNKYEDLLGIEALKKIKQLDPSAIVVMCSAMGQQAMVIESIQAGAKDFIVKPFKPDRVLEAIQKSLS